MRNVNNNSAPNAGPGLRRAQRFFALLLVLTITIHLVPVQRVRALDGASLTIVADEGVSLQLVDGFTNEEIMPEIEKADDGTNRYIYGFSVDPSYGAYLNLYIGNFGDNENSFIIFDDNTPIMPDPSESLTDYKYIDT